MAYCAILAHTIRRFEGLRRWLYAACVVVLAGLLIEVVLLITLGAVRSRGVIGPVFYVVHVVFFLLGTPALANVLLLRGRAPVIRRWYLAGVLCTTFAFCLVLLQLRGLRGAIRDRWRKWTLQLAA